MILDWDKLLNSGRRKYRARGITRGSGDLRTEIERDYDRILFSTPVRRLADKTQVFPLEKHDSVRTRLTHSHEVSSLARSIGTSLAFNHGLAGGDDRAKRDIPALLAAIGLAHDAGNPPFGHEGEIAIQEWFEARGVLDDGGLDEGMRLDFLKFEGNAQAFRLVTKLQLINDTFGLNLTYASLSGLMKYPTASDQVDKAHPATKKHGFFQSERDIVEEVWSETGLGPGLRHPLTWVMEACDDIAYSVMDAEDASKKGLVSFWDLIAWLDHACDGDPVVAEIREASVARHKEYRRSDLSPAELNDISMQVFRVNAIAAMVREASAAFATHLEAILSGGFEQELIEASTAAPLCRALKDFDNRHAYQHISVVRTEVLGSRVIQGLLDFIWKAINEHSEKKQPSPLSVYIYQRISENYRRVFEDDANPMPLRYRQAQLLTDMLSGMTDSYAVAFYEELLELTT